MEEPKGKWATDDIRNAYEACTNIYAAAKKYGVSRTCVTLSDRVNNKVSMNARVGHPTSLSTTEEDSLVSYVYYMSERGFPLNREESGCYPLRLGNRFATSRGTKVFKGYWPQFDMVEAI